MGQATRITTLVLDQEADSSHFASGEPRMYSSSNGCIAIDSDLAELQQFAAGVEKDSDE